MSNKITHYIHGDLNAQVANDGDVLAWDDDEKIYKPTKIPAYITTKKVATLPSTPAINTLYLVTTGTENVYHQYLQTEDELIDMGLTTIEVAVATDGETIQENANNELEVKLNSTGGIISDTNGLKLKVDSGGLIKNDPTNGLKIDPGTNNAGKILRVKDSGTGAEWKEFPVFNATTLAADCNTVAPGHYTTNGSTLNRPNGSTFGTLTYIVSTEPTHLGYGYQLFVDSTANGVIHIRMRKDNTSSGWGLWKKIGINNEQDVKSSVTKGASAGDQYSIHEAYRYGNMITITGTMNTSTQGGVVMTIPKPTNYLQVPCNSNGDTGFFEISTNGQVKMYTTNLNGMVRFNFTYHAV